MKFCLYNNEHSDSMEGAEFQLAEGISGFQIRLISEDLNFY